MHADIAPDPELPADTAVWARLQSVSGGPWGGCVYDPEAILERLDGDEPRQARSPDGHLIEITTYGPPPVRHEPRSRRFLRARCRSNRRSRARRAARQRATSSGENRSTPAPLQVYVAPSQARPEFG